MAFRLTLDVLGQDYVRTAKAKGLSSTKVIGHASKNAMIPTVTLLGMGFAGLLKGLRWSTGMKPFSSSGLKLSNNA